jgi:hypothetical protein
MPLSEYEQRVLEQLERDLGADPKLNSAMAKASRPRGRWTLAVVGILAGLGTLVAGVVTQLTLLGIAGFALMLGAALWGMLAPAKKSPATGSKTTGKQAAPKDGFMRRVEERFDRRREQGDF